MTSILDTAARRFAGAEDDAPDRDRWARNFTLQFGARTASKIGDVLASPRHVLVWWLSALGVPAGIIGSLVPIREAGALLPQLWLASALSARTHRRGFYVAGLAVQGLTIAALGLSTNFVDGLTLGIVAIVAIALFSIGRSMASLSSKDLLGRTVPKGRRGRLGGTAASVAGVLTLAAGLGLGIRLDDDPGAAPALLVGTAAVGWMLAAGLARAIEEPGAEPNGNGDSPWKNFGLLRSDPHFGRFCLSRGLLAGTVLSMPYLAILSQQSTDGSSAGLGMLLIAASAAQSVSGWFWGRAADESSRVTMIRAGAMASTVLIATFLVARWQPAGLTAAATYGALFFLLGVAHTGIRQGRKTYVIDLAPDDLRPTYVAVANTTMGLVLVASTLLGSVASWLGEGAIVLLLATLGALGTWMARGLREVESDPAD